MRRLSLLLLAALFSISLLSGCRPVVGALFGLVSTRINQHRVVVTDCHRLDAPGPEQVGSAEDGSPAYRFAPCGEAEILIVGDQLSVNGIAYGQIAPRATVVVSRGVVLVSGILRTPLE